MKPLGTTEKAYQGIGADQMLDRMLFVKRVSSTPDPEDFTHRSLRILPVHESLTGRPAGWPKR